MHVSGRIMETSTPRRFGGDEDGGILVEGNVHARRTMVDHFPIGDGSRPFAPIVSPFGVERNLGSERDKRWPWPMEIVFLVFSAGPTNLLGAGNKPRLNGINAWQSRALPTFDTPPPTAFEPRNRSIRTVVLLRTFFIFSPSNG